MASKGHCKNIGMTYGADTAERQMTNKAQSEGPEDESPFRIVRLLKACTTFKDLGKGCKLHAYIRQHVWLEKNAFIGSTLVNMYAKCGALSLAERVLKELPVADMVAWNALIAGYVQQGQAEQALKCFDDMLNEGHSPTHVTFACTLKACGNIGAAAKGKEIHDKIVSLGLLEKDIVLGTNLVDMYANCGALEKAQHVHQELSVRNVVSWSTLIAGYAKQGQGKEALKCFDEMLHEGHSPTPVTFACVLRACGSIGAAAKGEEIYYKIISLGILEKDIVLGNALVDMYVKCSALIKAQKVLKELPIRNVVSWSALIAGYAQDGQGEEALKCFDDMLHEGHSPTVVTFICVLKACGSIRATTKGEQIHNKIVDLGMLERDIVLGNTLVDMYAKGGAFGKAQQVFEEIPVRDTVSWNALISGYTQHGQGEEALKCFDDMLCEGHSPTIFTFICALKACWRTEVTSKQKAIQDKIVSLRLLEKDTVLGNSLVDMYVKCGALSKAQQLLRDLPVRDVVTWNEIIAGYAKQGQGEEALKCFDDMLYEGHAPTAVTFICALKACGNIGDVAKGEEVHGTIINLGMLKKDIVLDNSLMGMYAKCGALTKAQKVLEELPSRSVDSWNTLIAGYAQHGHGEEALKCFDSMLHEGHSPDLITFICALKACGGIGAAAKGEEIYGKTVSLGMLEKDNMLGTTLIAMYAKCGVLSKAQQVLEELFFGDVVSWTALIAGYAQQGQSVEAINCFERMQLKGMNPNSITLTSVLSACSHSGLLDQAEAYFSGMRTQYGIHPNLEHYCCMCDLFGRAGKFNKALSVILEMPSDECLPSWVALMGACHKWGEVKIRKLVCEHVGHLDKSNVTVNIFMFDIQTAAGMQEEANNMV